MIDWANVHFPVPFTNTQKWWIKHYNKLSLEEKRKTQKWRQNWQNGSLKSYRWETSTGIGSRNVVAGIYIHNSIRGVAGSWNRGTFKKARIASVLSLSGIILYSTEGTKSLFLFKVLNWVRRRKVGMEGNSFSDEKQKTHFVPLRVQRPNYTDCRVQKYWSWEIKKRG